MSNEDCCANDCNLPTSIKISGITGWTPEYMVLDGVRYLRQEQPPEGYPSSPTWPYVLAFAKQMEAKLAENRHKGDREGWLKDKPNELLGRVTQETNELAKALKYETALDVMREAADVANMAMMTADAFDPAILQGESHE